MGKMQPELFRKVIDECEAGGTKAITFGSRGEPTIHPDFLILFHMWRVSLWMLKLLLMQQD